MWKCPSHDGLSAVPGSATNESWGLALSWGLLPPAQLQTPSGSQSRHTCPFSGSRASRGTNPIRRFVTAPLALISFS